MFRRHTNCACGLICVLSLLAGCQSAVEEAPAEAAVAESPQADVAAPPADAPTPSGPDAAAPADSVAMKEFTPPFPARQELFEPPKRAQSTVRRDESGDTVELKGFINVSGPKVVLSIDGVIAPIAEGDEKYGVQVISIDPPSVVLQRGRSRWTATLE
jgi:hypothetical protein